MAELRAGGLAIVIASLFHENIGKVVKLNEFVGLCGIYDLPSWVITALSDMTGSHGNLREGDCAYCPSIHMMPIDGDDFTHEGEREKEIVNG